MKVLVIGGGASGLMVGGLLCNKGYDVTIIDRNEKCGKKIYITGKGRCNLTNKCSEDEFLKNVVHGNKFLFSAINQFSPLDTINFFENLGLATKTERGNRVFPQSDKASDVTKYLLKNANKCKIILDEKVIKVDKFNSDFSVITDKNKYTFNKVIVATGGKSYPATGSTGDGYLIAKSFGINVIKPHSALVPIRLKDKFCERLEGVSLKNVKLKSLINGKKQELFGEMLWTNDAISGPIALSLSSYIGDNKDIKLYLDLKPALDENKLNERLLREFEINKNKNIYNVMKTLLVNRMIEIFLNCVEKDKEKKVNSITKEEREKIVKCLKNFELHFDCLYPIETGIVTGGGVDLKEINPKTMESKKIRGLYFIGEVLDIDCLTGGFNLQACFSTAFACANNFE